MRREQDSVHNFRPTFMPCGPASGGRTSNVRSPQTIWECGRWRNIDRIWFDRSRYRCRDFHGGGLAWGATEIHACHHDAIARGKRHCIGSSSRSEGWPLSSAIIDHHNLHQMRDHRRRCQAELAGTWDLTGGLFAINCLRGDHRCGMPPSDHRELEIRSGRPACSLWPALSAPSSPALSSAPTRHRRRRDRPSVRSTTVRQPYRGSRVRRCS